MWVGGERYRFRTRSKLCGSGLAEVRMENRAREVCTKLHLSAHFIGGMEEMGPYVTASTILANVSVCVSFCTAIWRGQCMSLLYQWACMCVMSLELHNIHCILQYSQCPRETRRCLLWGLGSYILAVQFFVCCRQFVFVTAVFTAKSP